MNENSLLRYILSDIIKGYTLDREKGIYIKHLTLDDYVDNEILYDNYYQKLRRKGVENNEELLSRMKKLDFWSDEKENQIKELEETLKVNRESSERATIKEMADQLKEEIKKNEKHYYSLLNEKMSFIAGSCETLAEKKVNEYYIIKSLYKDSNFKEPLLTEEDMEDMDTDINKYVKIFVKKMDKFSDKNIKKIAIKNFFRNSWDLAKSTFEYYGQPISQITYYQANLASYAITFGRIFENYPGIDSDDPDQIIEFSKKRREIEKRGKNGERTLIGMSPSDAEKMGVEQKDIQEKFANFKAKKT